MRIVGNDEFSLFFRALPFCVAAAALAFFLTRTPLPPAPANELVFGCYSASRGPPILLDEAGMHVRQAGFPSIGFHLERSKTGIVLTAEAPIRADRTHEGYQFGISKRGVGWFLDFYRVEDGKTYGVFDDALLEGFQMLATDGVHLNYVPTGAATCA